MSVECTSLHSRAVPIGAALLLYERLKLEKEKAEREKAEREKAERWELSDREKEIVRGLN